MKSIKLVVFAFLGLLLLGGISVAIPDPDCHPYNVTLVGSPNEVSPSDNIEYTFALIDDSENIVDFLNCDFNFDPNIELTDGTMLPFRDPEENYSNECYRDVNEIYCHDILFNFLWEGLREWPYVVGKVKPGTPIGTALVSSVACAELSAPGECWDDLDEGGDWTVETTATNIVVNPPRNPQVSFSRPDTALCQFDCYNPKISAVVGGLNSDERIDFQLTYQIVNPSFLVNEKKYIMLENVGNGIYPITPEMFSVKCLWPGIPKEWPEDFTGDKVVEIHFGANLLDAETENCITEPCTTGGQDYYWYPWVCSEPVRTPEFPSMFLPVTLIIGFLGAVQLIRRTREN